MWRPRRIYESVEDEEELSELSILGGGWVDWKMIPYLDMTRHPCFSETIHIDTSVIDTPEKQASDGVRMI